MDPITDLQPMTAEPSDHVGDPTPPLPSNHAHPPYGEMITAAITALKDKDGSSRQAISKYIEKEYTNLPPTHSVLLTHHLKRLKNQGQLIMVKHSYMLPPRSVPFQPPTSTGYHPTLDFSGTVTTIDATATTASVNAENSPSGLSKRKPGRPPKLRPDSGFGVQGQMPNVQSYDADVPPYQPHFQYHVGVGQDFQTQTHLAATGQDLHLHYGSGSGSDFQGNSAGAAEPLFASLGLGDDGVAVPSPPPTENTAVVAKRGRGRPPKVAGLSGFDVAGSGGDVAGTGGDVAGSGGGGGDIQALKTGSGRPVRKPKMMSVMMGTNGGRVKKGRGRPKRIGIGPVTVPLSGNVLRPRGRPRRAASRPSGRPAPNVAVNGGVGESGLALRRSGRPSISGGAKIAKLTGKPLGRPSKVGPGTAVLVTDPRQLVVYQELKSKYELLQSKVKQVASVVKSCIDPDYGNAALGALQELEALAGADINAPSHVQTQEPAPFPRN